MRTKLLIATILAIAVSIAAAFIIRHEIKVSSPFYQSLEALSATETIFGDCQEDVNACMWRCPVPTCGALYQAVGDHLGPGYNVRGFCSVCKTTVE